MQEKPLTQQEIKDQLSDITEIAEQNKVKLTPDIKEYMHQWMEVIIRKLQKGMDIQKNDIKFIKDIKYWLSLPEKYREQWPSIEDMLESKEIKEALSNGLSMQQYIDFLPIRETTYFGQYELKDGKINIKGILDLRNMNIKKLPEGLVIEKSLLIENNPISELPEDIKIGESLGLRGTAFKEFPKHIKKVGGTLDLRNTKIKRLPHGLNIAMDLFLDDSQVEKLPEGLHVGSKLYLNKSKIKRLPDSLYATVVILPKDVYLGLSQDAIKLHQKGNISEIAYEE